MNHIRSLMCLYFSIIIPLAAQTVDPDPQTLGRYGGLAIVAGDGAAEHAKALGLTGRWMVRVMANNPQQVMAQTESLVPLVTVDAAQTYGAMLPFTTDSVNLVILGSNSFISEDEAKRVLAPEGVLLTGSTLTKQVMPIDERYGSWAHFYGDAHASNNTPDELVGPSTSLRWFSQNMPAGSLRAAGGVVATAQDSFSIRNVDNSYRRPRTRGNMAGRDAFSGVALWYNEDVTLRILLR